MCCMAPGSVPDDDTSCKAAGGICALDSGAVNSGCTTGTKIGECKSSTSEAAQSCCKLSTTNNLSPDSGKASSLQYTPLENLPGFENANGNFDTYFKNLYLFALWVVALSALFMLIVGGFLYLSSAGNTHLLGTAKKTIYGALIGLIIALISWLILDTINPDLTKLKLSGLSVAAVDGGASSSPIGSIPPAGSGSCALDVTWQSGIQNQCSSDASQPLLDALKCMTDKVGSGKMQISSISDSAGFSRCQNNFSDAACAHTKNSCHYGGSKKNPKSCAADISTRGSAASKESIKSAARSCGVPFVNDEGNHVHISVSGCSCDGHS